MKIILEEGDPKPEIIAKYLASLKHSGVSISYTKNPESMSTPEKIIFESIKINTQKRTVKVSGEKIKLTNKEYEILLMLALRPEYPVQKKKILEKIWGTSKIKTRTVDTHILTLRSKLNKAEKYIKTIPKIGYVLSNE